MIVGKDFVWLHFPKCAGTSMEKALHVLMPGATFDPIDPNNVIWHDSITRRKERDPRFEVGNRRIISAFRRLPHWVLSRVHFEAFRPPHHTVTRDMFVRGEVFERNGDRRTADDYFQQFNTPPVTHWIRVEKVEDDMATAFDLPVERIRASLKHANAAKNPIIKSLAFWFRPEELRGLYAANPHWAAKEAELYGGHLAIDG
jgi:hypothetical protein